MRYRWLDSFSLFPCNQKGLDLVRWVRALRIRLIYMLTLELRLTRRPWSWLRNGIPVVFLFSFFSGKVSPAWIRSCVSSGLGIWAPGRMLLSTIPEDSYGMNEQSGTDDFSGGIRQVPKSRTSDQKIFSLSSKKSSLLSQHSPVVSLSLSAHLSFPS